MDRLNNSSMSCIFVQVIDNHSTNTCVTDDPMVVARSPHATLLEPFSKLLTVLLSATFSTAEEDSLIGFMHHFLRGSLQILRQVCYFFLVCPELFEFWYSAYLIHLSLSSVAELLITKYEMLSNHLELLRFGVEHACYVSSFVCKGFLSTRCWRAFWALVPLMSLLLFCIVAIFCLKKKMLLSEYWSLLRQNRGL